jgi:hypothetical protein
MRFLFKAFLFGSLAELAGCRIRRRRKMLLCMGALWGMIFSNHNRPMNG